MLTVRDDDGRRYHVIKRSDDSSLIRDPVTGTAKYVDNRNIVPVEGESSLETAAKAIPEEVRSILTAVADVRALGLLVEVVDRSPITVRELVSVSDYCEGDLYSILVEFRYAGLIEDHEVDGEPGYTATKLARAGMAVLRRT